MKGFLLPPPSRARAPHRRAPQRDLGPCARALASLWRGSLPSLACSGRGRGVRPREMESAAADARAPSTPSRSPLPSPPPPRSQPPHTNREIVYTLSPYQQEVFVNGIYKMPRKIAHFFQRVSVKASSHLSPSSRLGAALATLPDARPPLPFPNLLPNPQHAFNGTVFATILFGPIA